MEKIDNIQQLKKLGRIFNSDKIVTTEDLSEVLSGIASVIKSFKTQNEKLNADTEIVVERLLSQVESEHERVMKEVTDTVEEVRSGVDKSISDAIDVVTNLLQEARNAMPKDGTDGKDADEEYIISEVLNRIELPEQKEFEHDTGEGIVEKINKLSVAPEYQIDWSHIKNAPEATGGRLGSTARNLWQLNDVTLSNVANSDVLKYNSTTKQWENGVGGGGGASTLAEVATNSDTDAKSLYEMTDGVDVEFRSTMDKNVLKIRESEEDVLVNKISFNDGAELGYIEDITAWVATGGSYNVTAQESTAFGLVFSSDGTQMYTCGAVNDSIFQYTLATAWDVSTASYASKSLSVATEENTPSSIQFDSTGTRLFMYGVSSDRLRMYTLSTAWDISTGTYTSTSPSLASVDTSIRGFYIRPDGTDVFFIGDINDIVYKYTMSTAWNPTTLVTTGTSVSVASISTQAWRNVDFDPTGTMMLLSNSSTQIVYQLNLSTPWDITTATYNGDFVNLAYGVAQFYVNYDIGKSYAMDLSTDTVYEYTTTKLALDTNGSKLNVIGDTDVSGDTTVHGDSTLEGDLVVGTGAASRKLHVKLAGTTTTTLTYAERISNNTTGTAGVGFGTGVEYDLENASGTNRVAGTHEFAWSDATNATEDATYKLRLIKAGTLTDALTVTSLGAGTFAGGTTSLTSATTVVDVSASAAPSSGQILTATSTTAAAWRTPNMTLLGSGSGSVLVTAADANLSTIAISGLTSLDTLHIVYSLDAASANDDGRWLFYQSTTNDIIIRADNNSNLGNSYITGETIIRQNPQTNTIYSAMNTHFNGNLAIGGTYGNNQGALTAWNGSWNLSLRHTSAGTGSGTAYWSWAVYKIAGQ